MSTPYNPLVSIVVITYNSAGFILETLESVTKQTYANLEIIISDDCSKDNTVQLCTEWLQTNQDRFVRTQLITVPHNKGIAPNCNRGCKAAEGEWVKIIAGDDKLKTQCIADNIAYASAHRDAKLIFSDFETFGSASASEQMQIRQFFEKNKSLFQASATEQLKFMALQENFVPAISSFLKKEALESVNYYDERFPMVEDYPMWVKMTSNGIRLHFMPKATTYYRIHANSVSADANFSSVTNRYYKKHLFYIAFKFSPKISLTKLYIIYKVELFRYLQKKRLKL